jgi:hypothetical protein
MEWVLQFLLELGLILVIAVLWIGCIIDVVSRPDLLLLNKAIWFLTVLLLPIVGSVVYLLRRPNNIAIAARTDTADDGLLLDDLWLHPHNFGHSRSHGC